MGKISAEDRPHVFGIAYGLLVGERKRGSAHTRFDVASYDVFAGLGRRQWPCDGKSQCSVVCDAQKRVCAFVFDERGKSADRESLFFRKRAGTIADEAIVCVNDFEQICAIRVHGGYALRACCEEA